MEITDILTLMVLAACGGIALILTMSLNAMEEEAKDEDIPKMIVRIRLISVLLFFAAALTCAVAVVRIALLLRR